MKNIRATIMLSGTFLLWVAEILLFVFVIPQYKSIMIDLIGLFFTAMSLIFARYAGRIGQKKFTPRKEISIIMAFSMIPLLLSLTAMLLYIYFVKENVLAFLITFGVFYGWFLVMKSVVLYKINAKNINSNVL